jgi:hypothetical protein
MDRWQLLKIAGTSLAAVLTAVPSQAEPPPGDYTFLLKHDGRDRSYIVHVPKDALTSPW